MARLLRNKQCNSSSVNMQTGKLSGRTISRYQLAMYTSFIPKIPLSGIYPTVVLVHVWRAGVISYSLWHFCNRKRLEITYCTLSKWDILWLILMSDLQRGPRCIISWKNPTKCTSVVVTAFYVTKRGKQEYVWYFRREIGGIIGIYFLGGVRGMKTGRREIGRRLLTECFLLLKILDNIRLITQYCIICSQGK